MEYVFDIEADGLRPTKIHCLSIKSEGGSKSTYKYANMRKFFSNKENILIGHNITRYDIPVVEKLLGVKVEAKLVDTLALSWYLYPNRVRHGLADWGEDFGIPKPVVDDWEGLTVEEYIHRCEEDVKINAKLWQKCWKHLLKLYGGEEESWKCIDYLQFKMQCAADQEKLRWKLDVEHCTNTLEKLTEAKEKRVGELTSLMPTIPIRAKRNPPAKPYKKDGSLSATGEKWFKLLEENNLPKDWSAEVEVVTGYKEPNPGSTKQVKDWLFSLGWEPTTFKFKREVDGFSKIPQVNAEGGGGLCSSVKLLYEKEPGLEVLDGLSVITHRIGILKGFLENVDEEGYVQAQIQGITNTLRFKHKVVVNLPGVDKPYGTDVRGCLIASEGMELVGSDMASLEDRTKQHYMWDYDPEYVKEMNTEGFDPHLDIGVLANMLTQDQADAYKAGDKTHHSVRHDAKQVNYSCTYGITPEGLVRNTGMNLTKSTRLHKTYWKRNWSIKAIADDCIVKVVSGQKWLFNPVSKMWLSLRHEKDRFSTLNQSTGVYCFDMWVAKLKEKGMPLIGQMHDEVIAVVSKGKRGKAEKALKWAIQEVNKQLKLNRELDCDVQFGRSYADIH